MDVVDVSFEILLVTQRRAPNNGAAKFPFRLSGKRLDDASSMLAGARKGRLYQPSSAARNLVFAGRQGPDCMKMIRKNDDRVDRSNGWLAWASLKARRETIISRSRDRSRAIRQSDGEEE